MQYIIGAIDFKTGELVNIEPDVVVANPPTQIGTVYYRGEVFDFDDDGDEDEEEIPHALFKVEGYDNPLVVEYECDLYDWIEVSEVKQVESHLYQIIHWSEVENK